MKDFFKFPFDLKAERNLTFSRKSTSFAYSMSADAINYGNALYETLQIMGSIPISEIEEMGYVESDLKYWNDCIYVDEGYKDQEFEVTYSTSSEYFVFPLLNLTFSSYQLSALEEAAFSEIEDAHISTLISEIYRRKKDEGCAVIVTDIRRSPFIKKNDADTLIGANLSDIMIFALQQLVDIMAVIVPEDNTLLRGSLKAYGYKPLKADTQIWLREPLNETQQ